MSRRRAAAAVELARCAVTHGGEQVDCRIHVNPRRRTRIALQLQADGSVRVEVPPHSEPGEIHHWLQARAAWLLRHRARLAAQGGLPEALVYAEGGEHLYLGEGYPLHLVAADGSEGIRDGVLHLAPRDTSAEGVQRRLWQWYARRAAEVFAARLQGCVAGVDWLTQAPPLRLRRLRRRWGSCSSQGVVTLNTHLVKAAPALIDYVLLHELCHLRELNHSHRFYALLEALLPDWRDYRAQLQAQAARIGNE